VLALSERKRVECVAELGIAPSLGDYEPPVQLYTTPRLQIAIIAEFDFGFKAKKIR